MSFDQSLPKWTLRSLAKIFPWGQRSVFNELKYFSIDFFILLFKVLLDRVTFYRLLLSIFLVVTFLKKQFHPYLRPFFWEPAIEFLLIINSEFMVLDLKWVLLLKGFFAILFNLILKLNSFLVKIIRRVLFSMSCYPGCLVGLLLWLYLFQLLLLFFLLPLLVDLTAFRRIFFIYWLHFLLNLRKQRSFSIIINGFLLSYFFWLYHLTFIVTERIVSYSRMLLTC